MVKIEEVRKNGRRWVKVELDRRIECNRVQVGFDEWRRVIIECGKWIGNFGGYWVRGGRVFDIPWDGFWRVVFSGGWGDFFRDLWFGGVINGDLVDLGDGVWAVILPNVSVVGGSVGKGVVRWFKPLWSRRRSSRGKGFGHFELVGSRDGVRIVGFVPFKRFGIVCVGGGFRVVDGDVVRDGLIPWDVLVGCDFVDVLRSGGRVWGSVSVDLFFGVDGMVFG